MKKLVLVSSTSDSNEAVFSQSGDMSMLENSFASEHQWVTVVNPTNHRLLLQACDDCGVVKSENSILRTCRASKGQGLVSRCVSTEVQLVS